MKVLSLVSAGKDSCYCMLQCIAAGHEIVGLGNLRPKEGVNELDSYMYQSVGHEVVPLYAEAMGLPLFQRVITGYSCIQGMEYEPTPEDEVEDLYQLLLTAKKDVEFDAVSSGAILSDYQRLRVENVCSRLGLVSLAYLWRRNQLDLLDEIIGCGIKAIIVKVASLGLLPDEHLGRELSEIRDQLVTMKSKYKLNVCGEGGEYETLTLDCPLFNKRIEICEKETFIHSNVAFAPTAYLKVNKARLVDKSVNIPESLSDRIADYNIRGPVDFITGYHPTTLRMSFMSVKWSDDEEDELGNGVENVTTISDEDESTNGPPDASTNGPPDASDEGTKNEKRTEDNGERNLGETCGEETIGNAGDAKDSDSDDDPAWPVFPCKQMPDAVTVAAMRVQKSGDNMLWIGGLSGRGTDASVAIDEVMVKLEKILLDNDMGFGDVIAVTVWMQSLTRDYGILNERYATCFRGSNPPVRACVEVALPEDVLFVLDVYAGTTSGRRLSMYVQSVSHWAPANIGPYSQSVKFGGFAHLAGQISLVPGSMEMLPVRDPQLQSNLVMRHVKRVLDGAESGMNINDVVVAICYTTDSRFVKQAKDSFLSRVKKGNAPPIVLPLVVTGLPRGATVEWQVIARMWNDESKGTYERNTYVPIFGFQVKSTGFTTDSGMFWMIEYLVTSDFGLKTGEKYRDNAELFRFGLNVLFVKTLLYSKRDARSLHAFFLPEFHPNLNFYYQGILKHEMFTRCVPSITLVPIRRFSKQRCFLTLLVQVV